MSGGDSQLQERDDVSFVCLRWSLLNAWHHHRPLVVVVMFRSG